jgi:hypothetical protein
LCQVYPILFRACPGEAEQIGNKNEQEEIKVKMASKPFNGRILEQ